LNNWTLRLGFLTILFLSSCATQQDLVDLQRQLQTTRGELATVRKQMTEAKTLVEGQIRASDSEQKESLSRLSQQMSAVLSTIEAQQKAIASLNSFVSERLSTVDAKSEERLRKLEERIIQQEKGYLGSQGNLGTRLGELAAEVKIVQGKLEENNNLLAEQGARLDEMSQQAVRSGSRMEAAEGNLRSIREVQASYGEKLQLLEGQLANMLKSWEGWHKQADLALRQVEGLGKRLEAAEVELRAFKESYERWISSASLAGTKEKEAGRVATSPPPMGKETPTLGEGVASASPLGGDEIYRSAYADYSRGAYELAISGFRDYLAKYPKGSLGANSQYWLGECYYSQKKFKEAIAEFDAVTKSYPKSAKAPGALLKKGYCYLALGDAARAKSTLMEVFEKYPKTREAALAEDQLGKMK